MKRLISSILLSLLLLPLPAYAVKGLVEINNDGTAALSAATGLPLTTGVTGILPILNGGFGSDTTGAPTDSILRYNGTAWVAGSPAASSAGPGIEFFNATPAIEVDDADNDVPISTLSKTPIVTAEQTISGTGDGASTAIAFWAWLYDTALGRTTIDAGVWQFETYVAINVAGGTTTLTRQVYAVVPVVTGTVTVTGTGTSRTATASAGTPFNTTDVTGSATSTTASYLQTPKGLYQITARADDTNVTILTPTGYTNDTTATFNVWRKLVASTTDDINDLGTNYTLHTFNVVSGSFTITALTKLGAISFVSSTASRIITLAYNGTARNTHFTTPLVTMHNNLAGLDGGTAGQFFHLTSAEYTGSGTGVFARVAAPTFTTSAQFGTVSAATGSLKLAHASSANLTTITAGNATAAVTYSWPTADGSSGHSLQTNGSGALSFAAAPTDPLRLQNYCYPGSTGAGEQFLETGTTTYYFGVFPNYTLRGRNAGGGAASCGTDGGHKSTTEVDVQWAAQRSSGTAKNLSCIVKTAPGAGDTYVFVVRQNEGSTTLTCTISGTDRQCSDTSNTFAVTSGDRLNMMMSGTGTPAGSAGGGCGFEVHY